MLLFEVKKRHWKIDLPSQNLWNNCFTAWRNQESWKIFNQCQPSVITVITVAQMASFSDMFIQKGQFWHILANFEKLCLNNAKIASMPQVYIHIWSFEPNLTAIFKYLLSRTVRQNSLSSLSVFLPKNRPTSGFWWTVLDSWYLKIVFKLGSNDWLWI